MPFEFWLVQRLLQFLKDRADNGPNQKWDLRWDRVEDEMASKNGLQRSLRVMSDYSRVQGG